MKKLVDKVRSIRALAKNAKRAAEEIVDQYGDRAMARVGELEEQTRSNKKILEYFYWKVVRAYIRDVQKNR